MRVSDPAALPRLALAGLALLLLWPALRGAEIDLSLLLDASSRRAIAGFVAGFFPPDLNGDFLRATAGATVQTLAMATAGVTLAAVVAVPLALVVTRILSISRIGPANGRRFGLLLRAPARLLLAALRGIPEIVWALLFVRAAGLGPAAGVFAIAVTYGGMLGKVYSEILESIDPRPAQALLEAGAGRLAALGYGLLPQALPELVSYTTYRWECAVRASVVLGFVGAGGLGQQLELSLRMLNGGEVATVLLVFLLLVAISDGISTLLRRGLE